jgi:photosystem II stability/assembly factor-like uncharacterized protein
VQSWPYSTPLVCPSVERCLLVAATGDILRSADGARSWSQTRPGTGSTLAGIACPSATRCYAAGQAGTLLETADGITWTRRPAPLGKIDVDWSAITCTTTSVCLLAGPIGIARTADGGATWSLAYALSAPVALGSSVNSVTCSGRSTCYAVGQRDGPHGLLAPGLVLRSTNGGATWKALPGLPAAATPGGYYCCQANSIACISAKVCVVATGAPGDEDNEPIGALFISHDRGKTWTKRGRDRNAYFSLTCNPTGVCTAAGASTQGYPTVERIDASGTLLSRWTVTGYGQESLNGVSCLSASACYAVGDGGLLLRSDNGRRWVAAQLSAGNLMATACRGGTCYAAGEDSVILSTREP